MLSAPAARTEQPSIRTLACLQFIACNKDRYVIRDEDRLLIQEPCRSGAASSGAGRAAALLATSLAASSLLLLL